MGRKLNISQPAVIQTELRPLDESFWIDANGGFEQWYYQNTNVFAPDRQITPLILSPHLSAIDRDTNTAYTPTFQLDSWEVKEYIDGAWVTTVITNQSQNESYVVQGLNLIVKKNNYDATHAINITCKATYQDPRDVGVLCRVQDSVMLVTSIDATQSFPTIDIVNPATRTYNPLKDESPVFEFEGKADWDGVEAQGGTAITECKVDPLGTEKILPTNDEMVINAAPTLNIKYGDVAKANQKFVYRQTANGEVPEIVGGVSAIDDIKGNTVAWNQIFIPYNSSSTQSGITMSGNGDGWITITNNNATGYCQVGRTLQNLVSGHIYCCRGWNYDTNKIEVYDTTAFPDSNVRGPWILPCTVNGSATLSVYAAKTTPSCKIAPQLFDLTLIFGAGNEPSTVAEFETWLSNNVGLKDYYEYCSGKLVNFGGYGVKWNQLYRDTSFTTTDESGITYTVVDEFTWNINGTASNENTKSFVDGNLLDNGHKYYLTIGTGIAKLKLRYGNTDTEFGESSMIFTSDGNNAQFVHGADAVIDNVTVKPILIDLTLMFGAGNEPTLEWCDKYFSRDYYEYCPALDTNIMGVAEVKVAGGFNKWDEVWERGGYDHGNGSKTSEDNLTRSANFIPVTPSTTYYGKFGSISSGATNAIAVFYGASKNYIGYTSGGIANKTFTTPDNCYYITFYWVGTTYNHDICINISDSTRNGTYEPYHAQYKSPEMGIKTIGFNQWDEEWKSETENISSNNFIPVIGGATYFFKVPVGWLTIYEYDANKVYNGSSYSVANGAYALSTNCAFIKFLTSSAYGNTYNHDICINISDPLRNGTYEPYWESKSDMSWITKIGIENFNIWDEEWELGSITEDGTKTDATNKIRSKNFIPVSPNTTYYWKTKQSVEYGDVHFYDNSKNHIGYFADKSNKNFTAPNNSAYILFNQQSQYGTTYNHDICINKSIDHFNGRYYPHGETAPYFPNGLCNAGSAFDEVKVENGKIKGVVRFGSVDLGTLDYNYDSNFDGFVAFPPNTREMFSAVCSKYPFVTSYIYLAEKTCAYIYNISIIIRDSSYSDASTFKSAMQGVMLYYELATPYEFEIDYPTKGQFMWYGVNGSGSEVPIDQLPIYSQATQPSGYGQGTSRININALYGENIPVMLRVKRYPWSPNVLPPKVTKSVAWSVPPIDVITTCDKGSAVRATNSSENFIFGTIVNQQGEIISDEKKAENMVFDWYMVKYGTSGAVKTSQGSGLTKSIPASTLKNTTPSGGVTPSTNVYCEAFLLGAYHLVDGQYVRTKD